ncbi:MAG: hypothetical protein M3500_13205, partial [Actinomycetota bacterium]|nr:hypothetical protein [Actinomycetota bacterium]
MSALVDGPAPLPRGHRVAAAVADVGDVLAGVADVPLWSLTDNELPGLLETAGTVLARLQGLLVNLVGEIDSRGLADTLGASSTTALTRQALAVSPAAAAELT